MKHIQTFESIFDKITSSSVKQQLEEELIVHPFKNLGSLWELHTLTSVSNNELVVDYRATDYTEAAGQYWVYHATASVMIIYRDYELPAYYDLYLTRKITANYQLKNPGSIPNPHLYVVGIKRKTKCETIHDVRNKMEIFYDKFWNDQNNIKELIETALAKKRMTEVAL